MVPAGRSLDLTLVLEYVDQDLSTYLSKVPASGLSRDAIKVIIYLFLYLVGHVQAKSCHLKQIVWTCVCTVFISK